MRQKKADTVDNFERSEIEAAEAAMPVMEQHESILSLSAYAQSPPVPPFHPSNYVNYIWDEMDESSLAMLAGLDPESRRIYQKLGHIPSLRRYDLGSFRIDEYHSVAFEVVPALGEVSYHEVTEYPPGAASPLERLDANERPSPLARFLQLTDKTIAVPLMLWEFDDRSDDPEVVKALQGRELVDSLDNPGRLAGVDLSTPPPSSAAAVWTCFSGGDDAFSAAYCESKGIWYCDNDAWLSLTRSSGSSKRYVSHSRVAACGGGYSTYLEHQYRYWNWWKAKWVWTTVKYPNSSDFWQILSPGSVKY